MTRRGPEVPQDRIADPRDDREARALVARPLADVAAGGVADVVLVEQKDGAEIGRVESFFGTAQTVGPEPREVHALLPVHRHRCATRCDQLRTLRIRWMDAGQTSAGTAAASTGVSRRYHSASSAAAHPVPAAVMAWR